MLAESHRGVLYRRPVRSGLAGIEMHRPSVLARRERALRQRRRMRSAILRIGMQPGESGERGVPPVAAKRHPGRKSAALALPRPAREDSRRTLPGEDPVEDGAAALRRRPERRPPLQ